MLGGSIEGNCLPARVASYDSDRVKQCAQALVATVDSVDAFSLLQNMAPMSYDSSRLVDVACIAYAHIDTTCITTLRHKFFATVEKQFQVQRTLAHCLFSTKGKEWSVIDLG